MHSIKITFLCQISFLSFVVSTTEKNRMIAENKKKEKCYPVIGCFSLEKPWNDFWRRKVPRSPSALQIEFILITRSTPSDKSAKDCKIVVTDAYEPVEDSLVALDYSATRPYTVLHIWGCAGKVAETRKFSEKLIKPYLKKRDINLIFVLWNANILEYRQCVSDARTVAAVTSVFIQALIRSQHLTMDKIHLVGESIGAHIVGYIGKKIPNVYRITALDPAQPAFEGYDPEVRLDRSDALHVDALHTTAVPFRVFHGFGFINPIGDVDFYFNNCQNQPGCSRWTKFIDLCSHTRVNKYWIEALQNECVMWGVKKPDEITVENFVRDATLLKFVHDATDCKSEAMKDYCSPLGWDTHTRDVKGVFHIETSSQSPYCHQPEIYAH